MRDSQDLWTHVDDRDYTLSRKDRKKPDVTTYCFHPVTNIPRSSWDEIWMLGITLIRIALYISELKAQTEILRIHSQITITQTQVPSRKSGNNPSQSNVDQFRDSKPYKHLSVLYTISHRNSHVTNVKKNSNKSLPSKATNTIRRGGFKNSADKLKGSKTTQTNKFTVN